MAETPSAKTLLAICVVVVVVLGYDSFRKGREIEHLKSQAAESVSSDTSPVKTAPLKAASLEDQGACARQAAAEFKREGFTSNVGDDFTSHFSAQTGHCYVVMSSTTVKNNIPTTSKTLSDAFEGKIFGSYFWINLQGKKFWEVQPSECKVTMPNGEEKRCTSSDAWDELTKAYTDAP